MEALLKILRRFALSYACLSVSLTFIRGALMPRMGCIWMVVSIALAVYFLTLIVAVWKAGKSL